MPPRLSRTERDRLKEAVKYQDIGKGLGPRLAKVLAGGVDGLLDQMETLVGRYAAEIGDSPANASRWLSSVWGPYDRDWLYKVAGSLPEPLAGKWAAAVAAMRRDRQVSRRKAIAYASRMTAEMIEQRATEVAGPPLGKVAQEASARTAFQVSKAAGVGFSFSLPNQAQIERVMKSAGVSKQIKGFSQTAVKAVEDEVVSGMMAGESIEDIARRIRKNSDVETMVRARRIARTMSTDCAAEAKLMEYQEIGVEEYEIRCVYDERTCATCGAMDKKRFPVAGAHPRPSFHPNCRCLVVQVLPPELVDRLTRSARDEDGKTIQVPASMTYDEWRRKFAKPAEVQGGLSKAKGKKKAYQHVQAAKAPQKASTGLGNGNPKGGAGTKPTQAAQKSQDTSTVPVQQTTPGPPDEKSKEMERKLYPEKVAGVERGEPMSFTKADSGSVNPGYSMRRKGFTENCQTCVIAYEMRRRGYNVQAKPYSSSNAAQVMLGRDARYAWYDPETGRKPRQMEEYRGTADPDEFRKWLDDSIKPGERYFIRVRWTGPGRGGHVVCADKDADGVRIYDPQINRTFRGVAIDLNYTNGIHLTGDKAPKLLRVDNLAPEQKVVDLVLDESKTKQRRGGKNAKP